MTNLVSKPDHECDLGQARDTKEDGVLPLCRKASSKKNMINIIVEKGRDNISSRC